MEELLQKLLAPCQLNDEQFNNVYAVYLKIKESGMHLSGYAQDNRDLNFTIYSFAQNYKEYFQFLRKEGYPIETVREVAYKNLVAFKRENFCLRVYVLDRFNLKDCLLIDGIGNLQTGNVNTLYGRLMHISQCDLPEASFRDSYNFSSANFRKKYSVNDADLQTDFPLDMMTVRKLRSRHDFKCKCALAKLAKTEAVVTVEAKEKQFVKEPAVAIASIERNIAK